MSLGATIRPASEDDLDSILTLQDASHGAPRWKVEQYRQMLTDLGEGPRHILFVADIEKKIAGYAAASEVLGDAELETVVVGQEWRREGLGEALVMAVSVWALQCAWRLQLEVRASNEAARCLYEKLQFATVGERKGYYSHPAEDAVIMVKTFGMKPS